MADNRRRRREIDIFTSGTAPGPGWRVNAIIWGGAIVAILTLYYFEGTVWWLWLAILGAVALLFGGWVAWFLFIKRGLFTWLKLAQTPAKLMAIGDAAGAETAFARAMERANRFAVDDHRRGAMLCELAMFVKNQGRIPESLAMYEECVGILANDLARDPLDYFVGLNNYAICFIHLRDFDAAQKLLEKALDHTLASRKNEAKTAARVPLQHMQLLEFVLHLNLAFLFIEMHELDEAEAQLREVDDLAPLLSARSKKSWHDHYIALCAYWEFESGNLKAAEKELAAAEDPDYPACLRVRAKLALAHQEYDKADALLLRFEHEERKKGTLHRPELYKTSLDLAECRFNLGKHDDAFDALQEARSIVADFNLPMDAHWRGALQTWLQRAQAHGKTELAASLEADLQKAPSVDHAITILDKFRSHRE